MEMAGDFFQDAPEHRVATWAIIRQRPSGGQPIEMQRGNVAGWLSTVPRGEISAYIHHLKCMGPRGTYIGDCARVVRAAVQGVMPQAASSTNVNADLWKQVRSLQADVGLEVATARKTKAHRARRAAEESTEDPID